MFLKVNNKDNQKKIGEIITIMILRLLIILMYKIIICVLF